MSGADCSERDGEISPLVRVGIFTQESRDAGDDRSELVVSERPDQDAAGVMTAVFAPFPQQRGEVAGVAGKEYAILAGSQFQYLRIVERTECRVGREAQNVVTVFVERRTDPFWRQVGVE